MIQENRLELMGKIKGYCIVMMLFIATAAEADPLCFDEAGMQYGINPQILRAIARVESGFNPRAVNWNTNGSYDFGVMQINSSWGHTYGEEWWSTLGDPCTNIKAGAMILASCMKKYGYTWEGIGCYNSQTPGKRNKYALTVFKQLQSIERIDEAKAIGNDLKELPAVPVDDMVETDRKSGEEEYNFVMQTRSLPETGPGQPVNTFRE